MEIDHKNEFFLSRFFKGESFKKAFKVYPMTFVASIPALIWGLIMVFFFIDYQYGDAIVRFNYFVFMLPIVCLAVESLYSSKRVKLIAVTVCGILLAARSFLADIAQKGYVEGWITILLFLLALALFTPRKNDEDGMVSWNGSFKKWVAVSKSWLFSAVASLVLALLIFTLDQLFDLNVPRLCWAAFLVVSIFVPFIIYLIESSRIGDSPKVKLSRFYEIMTRFIVLPACVIYMAVIYIYAMIILCSFSLPDGAVCWPVGWLLFLFSLTLFAIKGIEDKYPGIKKITKLLTYLMVVPLVLMTASIFYRIGQYGITPNRLYVVMFNFWGYAAVIWLILSKKRNLVWLPVSVAAVYMLASAIPFINFNNVRISYRNSSADVEYIDTESTTTYSLDVNSDIIDIPGGAVSFRKFENTDYDNIPLKTDGTFTVKLKNYKTAITLEDIEKAANENKPLIIVDKDRLYCLTRIHVNATSRHVTYCWIYGYEFKIK